MDIFLVPLGILVALFGITAIPALILYAVPVRCAIGFAQGPTDEKSDVTVSWGPVTVSVSNRSGSGTSEVFLCSRRIWGIPGTGTPPRTTGTRPVPGGPGITVSGIPGMVVRVLAEGGGLLREFCLQCRLEGMSGKVRIGFDNPAATGMVFGAFRASRFALRASGIFLEVEPVFDRPILVADVVLRFSIRHPLMLIIRIIRFIRIPVIRRSFAVTVGATGAAA